MERILAWGRRRPWSSAGLVLLALLIMGAVMILSRTPRLDRDWVEHLAVMPTIEMRDDGFSLAPATDWTYDLDGPTQKNTVNFEALYPELRNVWFVVEPQPGGDYAAHTLVLFEFAGDRIIGLTVEARRETSEEYDAFLGLFNKFELAYIWSTAKELLNRRAVYLQKDVYVYPLQLSAEQKDNFLRAVLAKTQSISTRPRFYNTLTSNCTNELAKTAGLGWHYSWVLTGYSPQRLFDLKLIPGEDLKSAKAAALLTNELRSWNALPGAEFDSVLLAELRARHGEAP